MLPLPETCYAHPLVRNQKTARLGKSEKKSSANDNFSVWKLQHKSKIIKSFNDPEAVYNGKTLKKEEKW